MKKPSWFAVAVVAMLTFMDSATTQADIIITEIFYNLNGTESADTEWIEIANTGDVAVDLQDWIYGDSQDNEATNPFAAGTILGAKQAAILTAQDPSTFAQIWGNGIQVIQISPGISLSNSASPTNELLFLADASATVVDEVNYDDGDAGEFFPTEQQGKSIYLLASALDPASNDDGSNWALSEVGTDGAYEALITNPDIANATILDIASPGFVAGLTAVPEPSSLSVLLTAAALISVAGRRRK